MDHLLFELFRDVTGGRLDPLLNPLLDCHKLLLQEMENGYEPVLYYEISYSRKNESVIYHSHDYFWFKDYYKISDPNNWKAPKHSNKALALLNDMSINMTITQMVNTYQIHPYKVVIGKRQQLEEMSNLECRFHYYNSLFTKEYDKIKEALYSFVYLGNKPKAKRKYVTNLQALLDRYISKVKERIFPSVSPFFISRDQTVVDIFRLQLQYLYGIYLHLHEEYSEYMDLSYVVPFFIREKYLIQHAAQMRCIEDFVYGPLEDGFKDVICCLLSNYGKLDTDISFSMLITVNKVLTESYEILREPQYSQEALVNRLVRIFELLGVNTPFFAFYVSGRIEKKVAALSELDSQDFLRERIKYYKSLQESSDNRYNLKIPSYPETMLKFCEQLLLRVDKPKQVSGYYELTPEMKHVFSGSVAELGAFVRVMKESGMIDLKNAKKFVEGLCYTFSTVGTDSISPNSLYNKYITIDKKAAENLHHGFIQAIKVLDELKKK